MSSRNIAAALGAVGFAFVAASAASWTADLEPQEGSGISGNVRVEPARGGMPGDTSTMTDTTHTDPTDTTAQQQPAYQTPGTDEPYRVSITAMGLESGKTYAWFIRNGRCDSHEQKQEDQQQDPQQQQPTDQQGQKGSIVGSESAYQPLRADDRTSASASAIISSGFQEGSEYYAAVHEGENKSDKVVSCGDLKPATADMPATPPASPPGGK
jgi:hypothetical protein